MKRDEKHPMASHNGTKETEMLAVMLFPNLLFLITRRARAARCGAVLLRLRKWDAL